MNRFSFLLSPDIPVYYGLYRGAAITESCALFPARLKSFAGGSSCALRRFGARCEAGGSRGGGPGRGGYAGSRSGGEGLVVARTTGPASGPLRRWLPAFSMPSARHLSGGVGVAAPGIAAPSSCVMRRYGPGWPIRGFYGRVRRDGLTAGASLSDPGEMEGVSGGAQRKAAGAERGPPGEAVAASTSRDSRRAVLSCCRPCTGSAVCGPQLRGVPGLCVPGAGIRRFGFADDLVAVNVDSEEFFEVPDEFAGIGEVAVAEPAEMRLSLGVRLE